MASIRHGDPWRGKPWGLQRHTYVTEACSLASSRFSMFHKRFAFEILLIKTLNIWQRVHYLNSKPHSEGVLACQNWSTHTLAYKKWVCLPCPLVQHLVNCPLVHHCWQSCSRRIGGSLYHAPWCKFFELALKLSFWQLVCKPREFVTQNAKLKESYFSRFKQVEVKSQ